MDNQKKISKTIEQLQDEIDQLKYIINIYSMLGENTDVGIIKGKFKGNLQIEFINKEALDLLGFTREQFTAEIMSDSPAFKLIDDLETAHNYMKKLVNTENPIRFKTKIKRRDGVMIWIVGSGSVITDENGVKSCIFTFRNLASLQYKGKELIDLQAVEQNIESGILLCKLDKSYTIIYANEKLANILGYTYEEMQSLFGHGYLGITAKEDLAYLNKEVTSQLEHKNSFFITYRVVKKNGEKIWIEDRGSIVVREGQEDIMQCIITDITSQKEKEEALLISEKRHEIVMNYSGVATFDYDIRTKKMTLHPFDVEEFNFPTIIDNAVETVINSGMIFPESVNDYRELYRRVEAGDMISEALIFGMNADGKNSIYELSVTNIFDDRGNQLIAVGAKRDITEKLNLQREKEFAKTLFSDKHFSFEANVTRDEVISYDQKWAEDISIENIDTSSYALFISTLFKATIHPKDVKKAMDSLSVKSIMKVFKRGDKLISFIYRRKINSVEYRWFENNVNIIKDERSNDINIRCYIVDINDKKEKELAILEEQKYHKRMIAKATIVYTVNVSKNQLLLGHETWGEIFNIEQSDNYTEMMEQTNKKEVYPADQIEVRNIFSQENILNAYKNGKDQLCYSFRSQHESGTIVWARCTMNLFEDPFTGDVIGYSYTEDVDQEKKKELALIYKAEHDSLTDMYNKDCTEKYITDFLSTTNTHALNHAFFIIDIDHFKTINDNFGHAFGDAILSQVAGKIHKLFREEDIIGRIGGDEFVVFMKNIQYEDIAIKKTKEICATILDVFTQDEIDYKISASVGIAFCNKHGKTYQELYKHSDSALYISKENGRSRYTVYSENIQNTKSAVKEIDSSNLVESKVFANNISDYVFRILYEAHDKKSAITSVLELVGKHYNVSCAYIFEDSKDGKYTSNTFEWCKENIASRIASLQNISYDALKGYMNNFNSKGIFYMSEISKVPRLVQKALKLQNVKSMLQYSIVHDSKKKGFIGFDECECARVYEENEIAELQRISHILGLFILETRILEENIATKNMAMSIVNGLDSYAYVCDPKTYEVLFINDKAKIIAPTAQVGEKCYYAFWDRKKPCKDCPMKCLEKKDTNTLELYNNNLDVWIRATATYINWIDDRQVSLVNCVDITEYKK